MFTLKTAPAATTEWDSTLDPLLIVDPIPTKQLFERIHESKTLLGPTKTWSPTVTPFLSDGITVVRSYNNEYYPILIGARSPLSVTPYHTELLASAVTYPITHALGATNEDL